MKRLLPFLTILSIIIALSAFVYDDQGAFQVNYIVQNPKFFPNSIGYFRISGMKDKALQKRANDTLLKWFSRPTGFFKPTGKISNRLAHRPVDKDETMWIYRQMCQINNDSLEGIIFKNKDSVKVLGPSGYKGSGQSICTWGASIYRNRILTIVMEYDPGKSGDTLEDPLLLDLKTLQRVNLKATIVFPENQKAALQSFMKNRIEKYLIDKNIYQTVYATPMALDSIPLSTFDILGYLYAGNIDLYVPYTLEGTNKAGESIHIDQKFIFTLKEISPYSDEEYVNEIEALFN
jgi:hypothetical protein